MCMRTPVSHALLTVSCDSDDDDDDGGIRSLIHCLSIAEKKNQQTVRQSQAVTVVVCE